MGKNKKKRVQNKNLRMKPYQIKGQEDEDRMALEEHKGSLIPAPDDECRTRGKLIQKHKFEWKQVRKQIEELRKQRLDGVLRNPLRNLISSLSI